jgi:hypothetical protein
MTKKYQVVITETVTYTIDVDADTAEQARENANAEVDLWGVEPSSELAPDDIERQIVEVKESVE